jgi:hypothetical protein
MFEMDRSNPMAHLFYAWVLVLNRMQRDLRALIEALPPDVRDTVPARISLFLAYAMAGNRDRAQAMVTPQVEAAAGASDVFSRFLAQGFAMAGMAEPAMRWLEVAIDRGFINHPYLARYDPFFRSHRSDARFKGLLEIARDRWERFEA